MAYDSLQANYGRGQMGQFSPFRDTAKRRNGFDEEEEQSTQQEAPAPEPAPSPLAQAIAPKQSYASMGGSGTSVLSPQKTAGVAQRLKDESARGAQPKSGSFASVVGGAGGYVGAVPSAARVSAAQEAPADTSPLAKAVSGLSGSAQGAPAASGSGYTLTNRGGAGGGANQYTGFDFGQSEANRDTGKSAKYAFADLAAQSGVAMPTTKADAEAWARQYIVPGMNALGHEVLDVKGDKMLVRNWQGEGWVDFLVNADGANPQLAWQAEGGGGGVDPMAAAIGGGAADPVAETLAQQLGIDTSNPLWKQILDQLIADQSGQSGNTPPHATIRV